MVGGLVRLLIVVGVLVGSLAENITEGTDREGRVFSLFSIVQFPNQVCTSASSTTTYGTCYTSTECTAAGGTADGNCAAGFGVCCIIATSTCSSTITTNTSYVRNPGYPSTITPSTTGTCVYTVSKVNSDICQLRLDFQTMSGLLTTSAGACTDKFSAVGQTGVNPPEICGTNTGYHMYTEFGTSSTDTVALTVTYGSTATAKSWNILLSQIECDATWKAPTDCTQYFTGKTGTIYSYNFAGARFLQSQYYSNCLRSEVGYCGVQYKEKSGTTPDAFNLLPDPTTAVVLDCPAAYAYIPNTSGDGLAGLGAPVGATLEFQSHQCGAIFGTLGPPAQSYGPLALTTRQKPYIVGVYSDTTTQTTTQTGFALEFSHVAC